MKWLALIVLGVGSAHAAPLPLTQPCNLIVGSTVGAHPTRELVELLAHTPLKDEFTSTERHDSQLREFIGSLDVPGKDGQLCVSSKGDGALFDYDADSQTLWANVEAASGTRIFRTAHGRITVRDVVSDEWDSVISDRVMTNALGVSVDGLHATGKAASVGFTSEQMDAFHRKLPYHRFKSAYGSKAMSMLMDPNQARDVKPHAMLVFQYRLRSPYLAQGTDVHAATMDSPGSFAIEKSVVLGDLIAVGIVDGRTGEVLAVTRNEADPAL
ncbi:hypothetical protein [Stenotrophomonas maltophilia]|uniref:hypothetical protein n=1 Tax=Stenotrophomonas maltophilia TaxID=40324 RepID=UPI0028EB2627|nr:hypothetical protein [Stenotrophomonas maltophilia]WNV16809.1 hypothetical protein RS400_09780 [Stenotrophomonas maltophilia]